MKALAMVWHALLLLLSLCKNFLSRSCLLVRFLLRDSSWEVPTETFFLLRNSYQFLRVFSLLDYSSRSYPVGCSLFGFTAAHTLTSDNCHTQCTATTDCSPSTSKSLPALEFLENHFGFSNFRLAKTRQDPPRLAKTFDSSENLIERVFYSYQEPILIERTAPLSNRRLLAIFWNQNFLIPTNLALLNNHVN